MTRLVGDRVARGACHATLEPQPQLRGCPRRSRRRGDARQVEVLQDPADHSRFRDSRDPAALRAALGALQHVRVEDTLHQLGPRVAMAG